MTACLHLACAALSLLATATTQAPTNQPTRDNARSAGSTANDGSAFVPLAEGARWLYRTETSRVADLAPTLSTHSVCVVGAYHDDDSERFLVQSVGEHNRFEHWQIGLTGLLVFDGHVQEQISAVNREVGPRLMLACPVGAVTEWSWRELLDDEVWQWTARLEDYDATITVPAGTYCCVHIHCEGECDEGSDEEVGMLDCWFARGAGCVRQVLRAGSRYELRELLAFEPGGDASDLRHSLLELQLPTDWMWSPKGPTTVDWLDFGVESLALPGRFGLLDDGTHKRCVFVGAGGATRLDATDGAAWVDLLGHIDQQPANRPTPATFARLVARVMAHQTGETIIDISQDEGWLRAMRLSDDIEVEMRVLADNRPTAARLRLELNDSKLSFEFDDRK